jgi:protein Tex
MASTEVLQRISKEVGASLPRVETTLKLLEEGATVPFIARYRKEATGNLDEVKIRDIDEKRLYYQELDERRATILASIEKQGLLTDELKQAILNTFVKSDLEDLYLPYKPKRKSKAKMAIERGLQPLAEYIWAQEGTEPVETRAQEFVNLEKSVNSLDEALEGALHILAERVAENPQYRNLLRGELFVKGMVRARVVKGKEGEKTKYEMYYAFEELVPKIPSHRVLAIRRGTRENILTYTIDIDKDKIIDTIASQVIKDGDSIFAAHLERAVRDGFERLLEPSIQNELKSFLRESAEAEAIKVFEENLRTLLLAPPAGPIGVIGMDPGLRTGCKVAVVDQTGKFLENQTIYPTEPRKDLEGAEKTLLELIDKHNVRGIAIGNGTASRETESFVRSTLQKNGKDIFVIVVNESGASVYSASKRAREEFPGLDVTVRGAISIARRLQDPLAELVKIDPKSIGVGQYQHDVDQKKLKHSLAGAVESCVNRVGVDLNTASIDLLKYVSGIGDRLAQAVVAYRDQHGAFHSREQLKEIDGFGPKSFEQAAGFLRIKESTNPLDRTAVHPESYAIVERIAASLGLSVSELLENSEKIGAIDFRTFESEAGRYTLSDIREELFKPGRDPRDPFVVPKYREDVKEIADLAEGMELEGTVTNVTNFGAFVDLGVHQDGLVHISELSHKFVQDARQAVKVGDIVKVKVIGVDGGMKRISLSMKALQPKPPRRPRRKPQARPKAAAAATAAAGAPQEAEAQTAPPPLPRPARRPGPPQPPQPRRAPEERAHELKEDRRSPRAERPPRPAKETVPATPLSMEEKIRLLQEKFSSAR